MSAKQSSMGVNKSKLTQDLRLRQFSNTSIFLKDNIFVLSPSAQNNYNWFDLRKPNLDRYREKPYKGFLLIRFFDKFLFTELNAFISEMMPADRFVSTKTIGPHWKFNVIQNGNSYAIVNRQDPTKHYPIKEYTIPQLQDLIR